MQRQGRLAPSGPVQTHRSNVATYTSGSGVRSPQGPIRQNLGARPPAPPPDGPQPPAPPLDVTGEFFICQSRLFFTKENKKIVRYIELFFPVVIHDIYHPMLIQCVTLLDVPFESCIVRAVSIGLLIQLFRLWPCTNRPIHHRVLILLTAPDFNI